MDRSNRGEELVIFGEESDFCHSVNSYHSLDNSSEDEIENNDKVEIYAYDKDNPRMNLGAKFPSAVAFRRSLNHYAVLHDFEYNLVKSERVRVTAKCADIECKWRIHASIGEDQETFEVKTIEPTHTCHGVNKRGNKHATQGWVADRVINDLKKEDVPTIDLKKKLENDFGILLPYDRVWEGKELALAEIHGKWEDSFIQVGAFKEEINKRNPGSVVEFEIEPVGGNRHFQRFFIALGACTIGFLSGCRPYIGLDACHMKGKWKGVVAAATALDGNSGMFPVAFAVMEGENENSWEWFLRALHKAIDMPLGLVISADMQKGLQSALRKVYPLAEHRECMRHLFANFKKHFHGELFKFGLWGAAKTYSPVRFELFIEEMEKQCPAGIQYLRSEHTNLWSRSKFGELAKCDNVTNNISETFNAWIKKERSKPVIELLDSIRTKIMVKFDKRRRMANTWQCPLVPKVMTDIEHISRSVGDYVVCTSGEFCAQIQKNGKRWAVNLQDHMCTCRAWQVKGIPCLHATAFIASHRNPIWELYVSSYFTVAVYKTAYAVGIAPMPSRDEWPKVDLGYQILPPILKRPTGRPRKIA